MKLFTKIKRFLLFVLLFTIASCLLQSCFKDLPRETVVYQNNFENNNADSFEVYNWINGYLVIFEKKIISFNGNHIFGSFNNNALYFGISHLPPHYAIRLEFDLNIHDQWRNDGWQYFINGKDQLSTSFSNDSSVMQAYPNWLGNGSGLSPAGANAYDRNLPGLCSWSSKPNGTSTYKIVNTYLDSSSSFSINMGTFQSHSIDQCTLSWSIDNFKVTTINN